MAGTQLGQEAVFWLTPFFAILTVPVLMRIPAGAINHARARGLGVPARLATATPGAVTSLLRRRDLLLLALLVMPRSISPMLPCSTW